MPRARSQLEGETAREGDQREIRGLAGGKRQKDQRSKGAKQDVQRAARGWNERVRGEGS
jgi:hypothetical protein